jgi:hypothetical protein
MEAYTAKLANPNLLSIQFNILKYAAYSYKMLVNNFSYTKYYQISQKLIELRDLKSWFLRSSNVWPEGCRVVTVAMDGAGLAGHALDHHGYGHPTGESVRVEHNVWNYSTFGPGEVLWRPLLTANTLLSGPGVVKIRITFLKSLKKSSTIKKKQTGQVRKKVRKQD